MKKKKKKKQSDPNRSMGRTTSGGGGPSQSLLVFLLSLYLRLSLFSNEKSKFFFLEELRRAKEMLLEGFGGEK